jgi:hypothetical protein
MEPLPRLKEIRAALSDAGDVTARVSRREADALSATDEGRLIRKVQVALFMDGKLDSDAFQPLPAVMQFI